MALLEYLRRRGDAGASVQDIMENCEYPSGSFNNNYYYARRALQSDIKILREEYGAEIVFKRYKRLNRYCLKSGGFLIQLNLDEQDIFALVSGLGMAEHFIPSIKDNCKALWSKIKNILPENLINFSRQIAGAAVMATPVSGMDGEIFNLLILKALRERIMIEFDYSSPYKVNNKELKTHVLAPWGVFFRAHAWYLLAGKTREQEPYIFRLSRISRMILREDLEFIVPPEDYSQEKFAASAWYAAPGALEHNIKLKILEPLASIVSETSWHPTQKIKKINNNNAVELTAKVPDLKEVARWILSSAPYVTVEEPEELRELVRDWAGKMIELNK